MKKKAKKKENNVLALVLDVQGARITNIGPASVSEEAPYLALTLIHDTKGCQYHLLCNF